MLNKDACPYSWLLYEAQLHGLSGVSGVIRVK